MRTFFHKFAIALLLCFAISSCKKDETRKNQFIVDGTEFEISQGFIRSHLYTDQTNNIELFLLSPEINFREQKTPFSGTGNVIYFNLYATAGNKIEIADYSYNDSKNAGTFDSAVYKLNWDITQQPDHAGIQMSSGTIKIIKSEPAQIYDLSNEGKEYELSFSGTDKNNKAISGYFKGKLVYYFYEYYDDSLGTGQRW